MSDLISRSALVEKMNDTNIEIMFDLPVEELLGEDVDMDDFCTLLQDAIQAYRKLVISEVINNAPTVEAKPVVHCKDCIWWEDEHVLMSDGTRRPYTEEEKKNCPTGVTTDIGINVGSRCMVNPHITNMFRNADDYCSRADMRGGEND